MDEAKIDEIRQWVKKAQNDLGSAKRLSSGKEVFPDTAVFHCQQAAEKVLKAYLTLMDVPFAKIHDLSALVDECLKSDKTFEQLRDAAEVLTPYGTAFRYPGEVLEPEASDVQEAITLQNLSSTLFFRRSRMKPKPFEVDCISLCAFHVLRFS